MKNQFNKRWKAQIYLFFIKWKNKIILRNITHESYFINHVIGNNSYYEVISLIWTKQTEYQFAMEVEKEICKLINEH